MSDMFSINTDFNDIISDLAAFIVSILLRYTLFFDMFRKERRVIKSGQGIVMIKSAIIYV